jgi:hypothetical protein
MPRTRPLVVFPLLLIVVAVPSFGQSRSADWFAGERLIFSAEYLFTELGSLQFEMLPPVDTLGATLHHGRAIMRSNPKLPFVQTDMVFESYFDGAFNSVVFVSKERRADGVHRSRSEFNRDAQKVVIREWRELVGRVVDERTGSVALLPDMRDGIAMFYYLRSLGGISSSPQPFYVFSRLRPDSVFIHSTAAIKYSSDEVAEQMVTPVICRLPFTGIAGVKNEISSYFSTDGLAVPLLTEAQVYLGKVELHLVEQSRPIPSSKTRRSAVKQTIKAGPQ